MRISVFVSYSHRDNALQQKLRSHLSGLERQDMITTWHDGKINAGSEIDSTIEEHLRTADIILLLISSNFMASDYCWSKELKKAIERHEAGEAVIIPIILRPCDWKQAPFANLRALPADGRPVVSKSWKDTDHAFADVAKGLRDTVNAINRRRSAVSAPCVLIASPIDGSHVPRRALVTGSVTDPSADVWVIVHPESHVDYNLANVHADVYAPGKRADYQMAIAAEAIARATAR